MRLLIYVCVMMNIQYIYICRKSSRLAFDFGNRQFYFRFDITSSKYEVLLIY